MADAPEKTPSGVLPAGLSDLMPAESARAAAAITSIMGSFTALGYAAVKPPMVEFEDTLLADGPGSVLAQDTFRVMDPQSSRMMAIRADMTAQIARIASTRMAHHPRPLRLAYAGDVLRVRPDPLNPERQLTQVGAELIGANTILHDAELALSALIALQRAGVENLSLDLGAPRMLAAILNADDDPLLIHGMAAAVAAKDQILIRKNGGAAADILCRLLDLPMKITPDCIALARAIMADLPDDAAAMLGGLLDMAAKINSATDGISITIDPLESRGFDYHHGVGFAIFSRGIKGELGRGGRYATAFNNGEESTGVTLYLERVLRALQPIAPVKVLYIPHDNNGADDAGFRAWITQSADGHQCCLGRPDLADDTARHQDALDMGATHILINGVHQALTR